MADEKILDGEKLDADQLDIVSGGNMDQIFADRKNLEKLGFKAKDFSKTTDGVVQMNMNSLIADLATKGIPVNVGYTANKSGSNSYTINGESVTQAQFWKIVNGFYGK